MTAVFQVAMKLVFFLVKINNLIQFFQSSFFTFTESLSHVRYLFIIGVQLVLK